MTIQHWRLKNMIDIEYLYIRKDNTCIRHHAKFYDAQKALRFLYKLKNSKNMVYTGNITCDDPYDLEYIQSRFK